jgi:Cytochrome C and Quinol oxidase polypeptide I
VPLFRHGSALNGRNKGGTIFLRLLMLGSGSYADAMGGWLSRPTRDRDIDGHHDRPCHRKPPPIHDTYYIAAHLHYVLQLAVVFGYFAGLYYLFPKLTGYAYYGLLGRVHFWLLFIGVNTIVVPQVLLVTSVAGQVAVAPGAFDHWNLVSRFGSYICAAASLLFLVNMVFSLLRRRPAD